MNGFGKSGIFPVDGSGVLHALREKKRDILAMSTPAFQSLPPKESRFRDAREASQHIRHEYINNFSSPTRKRFTVVDDVLAKAVTLRLHREASTQKEQDKELRRQRREMKRLQKQHYKQ
uniref:WGS project CBMG000000000 data, contig CS5907-c003186 n=1 Tax=Fusarium acuminatum CS5907 TaxID=1318461 RepID=A0A090M9V0_9HYPO|nr:unnamed protein product [Fusarium acuminatum CS5907]